MTRQEIDFKEYSQFVDTSMPKQTLASFTASLRQMMELYADSDAKMKLVLVNSNHETENVRLSKILEIRTERQLKIKEILEIVWKARNNQGSTSDPTRKFYKPLDVFLNVTDTVTSLITDGETLLARQELEKMTSKLREAEALNEEKQLILDSEILKVIELESQILELNRRAVEQQSINASRINGSRGLTPGSTNVSLGGLQSSTLNTQIRGPFKLDTNTPKFRSRLEEDIDKWLIRIEASLTLGMVPLQYWITATYNYLEGSALEMAINANLGNLTWDKLKEDLINSFRPVNKDYDLRARLLRLKEGDSYDKYLYEFRALINQIPKSMLGDQDRYTCFVSGLKHKTRIEIFRSKCTSLEEAIFLSNQLNSERNIDRVPNGQINVFKVQRKTFRRNRHWEERNEMFPM
jgi:hypothetical protein